MVPIAHLGTRVSALLDGQLSVAESERAWAHVHACHLCRDLVEREGWIKTRLAGLPAPPGGFEPPAHLLGSLRGMPPGDLLGRADPAGPRRSTLGLAALGGGAVGAAVMGVLALGTAPADAPSFDRRVPTTQIVTPAPTPVASSGTRLQR